MVYLRRDDFPRVEPALERVPFNRLFAHSVVDGLVDGAVWVDHESRPALVHVLNPYGMTLLVVGDEHADLGSLRTHLCERRRTHGGLWLQIHPQSFAPAFEAMLAEDATTAYAAPVQRCTRVNFRFDRERFATRRPRPPYAPEVALQRMTAREFALPGVTVSPHMFWRDAAQCLAAGGGWCVLESGTVACVAFASFRRDEQLELGVETRPEHRGKGLGRIACAALIDDCLARGLTPVWACRKENAASYHLAQSLGFVPAFEGAYFHLPPIAAA